MEDDDRAKINGSKKALIIAVSDYDKSSGLKSIEFCKNDGEEMFNALIGLGYGIPENRKLVGYVDSPRLKNAIYDFFTNEDNKSDDTLVFYYSGHGIPDNWGTAYLAPSNIVSDHPFMEGFSFDDLTKFMVECNSLRIVTLLDSCFSGSLKLSKGGEDDATRIGNKIIEDKADRLKQGEGRCLLAASQGYAEAFDRQEKDHSIFTYYLLEGIKGHKDSVDDEGNVTHDTLGKFISREIGNLPPEKRPKQTPIRKGEVSGEDIILAKYPHLRKIKESDFYSLYGKGEECYLAGKYDTALECYDSILKIRPNNEHVLLRKGTILAKTYDDKKALEYFDQVIKINGNNLEAWYYKAQLSIKIGNFEKALTYLDKASSINPDDERIPVAYKKAKSLKKSSLKTLIKYEKKQDAIDMITILFYSANPANTQPLELIQECNRIDEELRFAVGPDKFNFKQRHETSLDDLQKQILLNKPQIIHFSGHGSPRSELVFYDENGKVKSAPPTILSNLFEICGKDISLVFLNACYSEEQAKAISKHVDFVIGMSRAISDEAARVFSISFYSSLGFGKSIEDSFELAKVDLQFQSIPEEATPVLLVKEVTSPSKSINKRGPV